MIVAADHSWVYVHNPKTGGHSIRSALSPEPCDPAWAIGAHQPASDYRGGGLCFGFVRNPWARMWSMYKCLLRGGPRDVFWGAAEAQQHGFRHWLLHVQSDRPPLLPAGPPIQRRPQTWWLDGCTVVGRFEALQEDFDRICQTIGLAPRSLPRANVGDGSDYRTAYDDEMITAVAEWFAPDCEQYAYEFGD